MVALLLTDGLRRKRLATAESLAAGGKGSSQGSFSLALNSHGRPPEIPTEIFHPL